MTDDDDKYGRKEPPQPHEWPHIFDGVQKSHKMWTVVGPIYAAVSNWKAWVIIVMGLAWLNKPEVMQMLQILTGGGQ